MAKEYGLIDRVMFGIDYQNVKVDFAALINWFKTSLNQTIERTGWPTLSSSEIGGLLGESARKYLGLT